MCFFIPYIKTARPTNALMTGAAVALGFWLGNATLPAPLLVFLVIAGISAASFGNVINDLHDIATDRISHCGRPLPKNEVSPDNARTFAWFLAFTALACGAFVSPVYSAGTALPLLLLTLYTRFFKSIPLAGNAVVSLLVGYALLFGALTAPGVKGLLVPALLAFMLNLIREIIKDLQDEPGDRAAGISTTASLRLPVIRGTVYSVSGVFLLLLLFPWLLRHFGAVYAAACAVIVLPVHILWLAVFTRKNWRGRLALLSLLIKIEMAAGLLALAADRMAPQ
jgi:geranylgeranylglycerol-phosphate geranylgeranyltransferase